MAVCFVLIPQSLSTELYTECSSKTPGRFHSLPADVDIPKVTKDVSLGRGLTLWQGKARKSLLNGCIRLGYMDMPLGKEAMASNLEGPKMSLGCLSAGASGEVAAWACPYLSATHQLRSVSNRHCLKPLALNCGGALPTQQARSAEGLPPAPEAPSQWV